MRLLIASFAILLVGCGTSMVAPTQAEAWQFTAALAGGSSTATMTCTGSGTCAGGSWALATQAADGCVLNVTFNAVFSTNTVSLSNFARSTDSTCTGPSLPRGDAGGTGVADAPFPSARSAQGSVKIPFVGVFYVVTGPPSFAWQAHRVS